MPIVDPSAPYAVRIGVHITIFLFAVVAWAILGDMIAPGTDRAAMSARVAYTMLSAIGLVLLTSYDIGFFFAAVAILTSGLFQTFTAFTGAEQLAILAGAFGVIAGSSYYLTIAAPGAMKASSPFYNDYY